MCLKCLDRSVNVFGGCRPAQAQADGRIDQGRWESCRDERRRRLARPARAGGSTGEAYAGQVRGNHGRLTVAAWQGHDADVGHASGPFANHNRFNAGCAGSLNKRPLAAIPEACQPLRLRGLPRHRMLDRHGKPDRQSNRLRATPQAPFL